MKTGIWLDTRQAYIIRVDELNSNIYTLESNIENYNPKGGSRSNVPYGPVDTVSEKKYLERQSHQERIFFDKIIDIVKKDNIVLIMGPAQAKINLKKRIEYRTELNLNVIDCIPQDALTENQMVEKVRKYFHLPTRSIVA